MRSPIKASSGKGRLNLFLLEMIIVLLFFSVASAVILKAFVSADRLSAENIRLERMAFCAQSAAEAFSSTADLGETAEMLFGIDSESFNNAARIDIPLDDKCGYAYLAESALSMTMQITETDYDGRLKMLHIFFKDKDGNLLYEINTAAYTPERTVLYGEE
ncbi:MAG: hypothetical protein J6K17_06500 [Oscillospiraceae bacterium]|nr:hypothetical protein [Oscillospiraceae bacterium]